MPSSLIYASKQQYLHALDYCDENQPRTWNLFSQKSTASFIKHLMAAFSKPDPEKYPEIHYLLQVIDGLAQEAKHSFKHDIYAETYVAAHERFKWMEEYCSKHAKTMQAFTNVLQRDIENALIILQDNQLPASGMASGNKSPATARTNYGDRLTSDSLIEPGQSPTITNFGDRLTSDSLIEPGQSLSDDESGKRPSR